MQTPSWHVPGVHASSVANRQLASQEPHICALVRFSVPAWTAKVSRNGTGWPRNRHLRSASVAGFAIAPGPLNGDTLRTAPSLPTSAESTTTESPGTSDRPWKSGRTRSIGSIDTGLGSFGPNVTVASRTCMLAPGSNRHCCRAATTAAFDTSVPERGVTAFTVPSLATMIAARAIRFAAASLSSPGHCAATWCNSFGDEAGSCNRLVSGAQAAARENHALANMTSKYAPNHRALRGMRPSRIT